MTAGAKHLGYEPGPAARHGTHLRRAGFVNVGERVIKWPIGNSGWKGKQQQKIADMNLQNVIAMLGPVTTNAVAKSPGLRTEAAEELRDRSKDELVNAGDDKRFYLEMQAPHSTYGVRLLIGSTMSGLCTLRRNHEIPELAKDR